MKAAILLAADIIRKLDKARLQFQVTTLDHALHPLLAATHGSNHVSTIEIHIPDHESNTFQPCTDVIVTVRPGLELPTVRAVNRYSYRSPEAAAEATGHTLTMFKSRLDEFDASFPMKILR